MYGQNGGGKQKTKAWPDQEPPAPGEGLRDFNALVAIPLSRQLDTDVGNLALLRGGHEMMAAGFRAQREAGGPLGPEGPGWDRFNANGGLELYHPAVREAAAEVGDGAETAAVGQDLGRLWPVPQQMLMDEGDAVIVHWATPHAAVRNLGADTRYMAIFRCSRQGHQFGLAENLCDVLAEWDGVRAAVRPSARL